MVIDTEQEKKEIINRYRRLLRKAKPILREGDAKLIKKAFTISLEAHKDMRRKSGEPYILHPLAVAQIAVEEIGRWFRYLLMIVGVGAYFAVKRKSSSQFMLADQSMPGWAVGLSMFGSYISSISFLALPGKAFADAMLRTWIGAKPGPGTGFKRSVLGS